MGKIICKHTESESTEFRSIISRIELKSILIPRYNEAKNISVLQERITSLLPSESFELIFIKMGALTQLLKY